MSKSTDAYYDLEPDDRAAVADDPCRPEWWEDDDDDFDDDNWDDEEDDDL